MAKILTNAIKWNTFKKFNKIETILKKHMSPLYRFLKKFNFLNWIKIWKISYFLLFYVVLYLFNVYSFSKTKAQIINKLQSLRVTFRSSWRVDLNFSFLYRIDLEVESVSNFTIYPRNFTDIYEFFQMIINL